MQIEMVGGAKDGLVVEIPVPTGRVTFPIIGSWSYDITDAELLFTLHTHTYEVQANGRAYLQRCAICNINGPAASA